MGHSRIPVRYAKALFALAQQQNSLDTFRKDMDFIYASCEMKEFRNFLNSPVISTSKKEQVIIGIFNNNVSGKTLDFLKLIVKNKRENYLPDISRDFIDMYKNHKGIKSVSFTSATTIDAAIQNNILAITKKHYNSEIELTTKTDESIIGGFIFKVDDKQYDASISTKLKALKRELTGNISEN